MQSPGLYCSVPSSGSSGHPLLIVNSEDVPSGRSHLSTLIKCWFLSPTRCGWRVTRSGANSKHLHFYPVHLEVGSLVLWEATEEDADVSGVDSSKSLLEINYEVGVQGLAWRGWGWIRATPIFFGCTTRLVGSLFRHQGLNPGPWQWKRQVLTTGRPGNSNTYLNISRVSWLSNKPESVH